MKLRARIKTSLRWLARFALCVAALAVVGVATFLIGGRESFGRTPAGDRLAKVKASPQWHESQFENPEPLWTDTTGAWRRFLFGSATPGVQPEAPIPVVHPAAAAFATPPVTGLRVTWFGHSSVLIEMEGTRVLTDPFWSERASPVTWAGPKRWFPPLISLSELPPIDAVVISHDHYDHLDRGSIVALAATHTRFVVPLGVGAHLADWGIPESRIVELDWWQSTRIGQLDIVATPARHKSGRFWKQGNQTLWAGYALIGSGHRAWYSGDTGFHQELKQIGERLGPFDVTLIDSGQYDTHWPDTHLGPELAVEAHQQVRGKVMIPVHWALLKLARHAWNEPVERVLKEAGRRGVVVRAPRPGESIEPTNSPDITRWWQ